jgi:copper homeostasis protein (lipoprotein)
MMKTNQGNVAVYILLALVAGIAIGGAVMYWRVPRTAVPISSITTVTPEPAVAADTTTSPTPLPTIDPALSKTYSGLLPCADCEGIQTELILSQSGLSVAEGTFVLKETYLGEKDGVVQSTGLWTTLRGTATDANATVVQLNPNKLSDVRYFLKVSDTEIKLLDKNQQEIDSALNYTLKTASATPALLPEAQKLVGIWRSTQDTKYTREFKAEGAVIDKYEGTTNDTQSGVWNVITDPTTIPTTLPAVGNATFINVVFGQDIFYYSVAASSTPDHLSLVGLNGKSNLDFNRVK